VAYPAGYDRPWAKALEAKGTASASQTAQDAIPNAEDLRPED